jgi:hypothetical protein
MLTILYSETEAGGTDFETSEGNIVRLPQIYVALISLKKTKESSYSIDTVQYYTFFF